MLRIRRWCWLCLALLAAALLQPDGSAFSLQIVRDQFIYLPLIANGPTAEAGRISEGGQPLPGQTLELWAMTTGHTRARLGTAASAADGRYAFQPLPDLSSVVYLWVEWDSGGAPGRLPRWICNSVTRADAEAGVPPECAIDVRDVPLLAPDGDANLPVTFRWQARGIPGERYGLKFTNTQTGYVDFQSGPLTEGSSYTFAQLPSALKPCVPYRWWVEVLGTNGYSTSKSLLRITFRDGSACTD